MSFKKKRIRNTGSLEWKKNQDLLFLFANKMSNARTHMARSKLKKTQVPNSQATKKKQYKGDHLGRAG